MEKRPFPDSADPRSERAAAALSLPAGAPPAAARATFLRRLPAAGLVPPPEWRSAVRTLTGQPAYGAAAVTDFCEDGPADERLRNEVEAFATLFWSDPPAVRRARWQTLLDRCTTDAPLAARLRRLEAGVDLPSIARGVDQSRSEELASVVQELFVLKPAAQAARRREQVAGLRAPASAWTDAARQLLEYQPAIAALEPALIERLAHPPRPLGRRAAAAAGTSWGIRVQNGMQVPRVAPKPTRRRVDWGNPARLIVFIMIVVSALIRAGTPGSGYNRPLVNNPASPPYIPLPTWRPENSLPRIGDATMEDLHRSSRPRPRVETGPDGLINLNPPPAPPPSIPAGGGGP